VNPQFLTIDELAKQLRSSRPTVTRAINNRKLVATQANGVYTVALEQAHLYLHRCTVSPDGRVPQPDLAAPLPRLLSFAEAALLTERVTGQTRRSLQDGARARPPRFEHLRIGRMRWLTDAQVDKLLNARQLARVA
jgi:excisionase family DNA binding protein